MPIIDGRYYSVFILTGFRIFNTYLMKTKTIEAHFCDHCNKLYQRKHAAIKHEERCKKNPVNQRPCFDCQHLTMKEYESFWEGPFSSGTTMLNLLFCNKKEHFVYPPHAGELWHYVDETNDPMPVKCGHYFIDQVQDMIRREAEITSEEFSNFKQIAGTDVDLAESLLLGFKERKTNPLALPF